MKVTLIGHPYAHIGMGEQLRSGIRSLQAVHVDLEVIDAYNFLPKTDMEHRRLMRDIEVSFATGDVRVFHINGDEVAPVLAHIEGHKIRFGEGHNIIVPAWELPVYPETWVPELRKFTEVWALSRFIQDALARSGITSRYVGQSAEIPFRPFLGRRHFGIRESAFVFLNFFDVSSYPARKNPDAVVRFYRDLRRRRPYDDVQFVVKIKGGDLAAVESLAELRRDYPDIAVIEETLSTTGVQSLISACDCFVSLHRSEGFGRGPAEAMYLGRLALATGWSGNVDYMGAHGALSVRYDMIDVKANEYPHGEGQQWAEPDVDHAVELAIRLLEDMAFRSKTAESGMRYVHQHFSNRAVGLRSLDGLNMIDANPAEATAKRPGNGQLGPANPDI